MRVAEVMMSPCRNRIVTKGNLLAYQMWIEFFSHHCSLSNKILTTIYIAFFIYYLLQVNENHCKACGRIAHYANIAPGSMRGLSAQSLCIEAPRSKPLWAPRNHFTQNHWLSSLEAINWLVQKPSKEIEKKGYLQVLMVKTNFYNSFVCDK